jgi:hypothetical protein
LIDLQGTATSSAEVGTFELFHVSTESRAHLTLDAAPSRGFGDPSSHKMVLVRIPRFGTLDIAAGAVLTSSAWNGATGGVLALRASTLRVDGEIRARQTGYRSGDWSQDGACTNNLATQAGESISGLGLSGAARNAGGAGGIAAAAGPSFNGNTPICASAGHARAGQPGTNAQGRTLGEPGAAYGRGDGTRLTLGSGAGGNLTCDNAVSTAHLISLSAPAGGIIMLLADRLEVGPSGAITAAARAVLRDLAPSGGTVLIRGVDLSIGTERVRASGAFAPGASAATLGHTNRSSDGYVLLDASGTLSGTSTPAFGRVTH